MVEEHLQTGGEHRLGGVVSGRDQLDEEAAEVEIAHRCPAEVGLQDQAGEIVLRGRSAPGHGEADGVHRHLHRRRTGLRRGTRCRGRPSTAAGSGLSDTPGIACNSNVAHGSNIAHDSNIARSSNIDRGSRAGRSDILAGRAPTLGRGRQIGILTAGVHLGQSVDQRPVLAGQTHQLADHLAGQLGGHVLDDVDGAASGNGGHDRPADRPDARLHGPDRRRLEALHQRPTMPEVAGRVHRQQHVAHHRQLLRRQVLQHDTALLRREQVRLRRHPDHVGVGQHRPVARLRGHLLPVHRLRPAQFGEHLVRRPADVRIGRGQVGRGHQRAE